MTDRPASWRMPTPKQMEKLAVQAARRRGRPLPPRMRPFRPNTGNRYSKTLAPARPGPRCGSDVFRKFSATSCASPAAAASGPSKSRPPMRSDCMAATRSGKTSRSDCSTTPVNSAPEDTKKTGAGRDSTSPSRHPSLVCAWMSGWRQNTTPRRCQAETERL